MGFYHLLAMAACAMLGVESAPAKRQAAGVPDYVLKYAPVVYLHSEDPYMPTDLQVFLNNTTPRVAFAEVPGPSKPLTLENVNQLGDTVYLTSNDDVTKDPTWIKGTRPDANGKTNGAVTAAVIVTDKGNGNVDAFYMYFYAYNYGGEVLGWDALNFGNHVGDWEHVMIRFASGVPQAVWYSQHANGQAFTYPTVEKTSSGRPVAYSARGSHANYAIPGTHDHTIPNLNLPGGVLEDYTDRGVYWDPLLSAYFYAYDAGRNAFTPYEDGTPTNWLGFKGRWGDQEYPTSDARQVKLFGQAKFASGPTGPADKQLNRSNVCPDNGNMCILRKILVPRGVEGEEE
ncbi:hypothetical protein HBI37_196220 [Parastagonospora nodorum]|nr:hypothetical protein HBI16_026890 [Parastagonospora nodorum]KAH6328450.1 hypothetical protein HBI37_196220 [Parastagonospora nodorum]KAH6372146.1 hypothetical protein HBI36_015060 [Parastagonospora nodorum]KAH6521851.1 hypothetical protein HBI07_220150 [Parastagonospora nodorum]